MAAFVLPFAGLRASDVAQAGGKGASLGELQAAGAPVPPGFVVTTEAFRRVGGDPQAPWPPELLEAVTQACQGLGRVAVRSSATAEDGATRAWAGQLETFLNVELEDVPARVRDCWASRDSERARAYGQGGEVAVVVQKMVEAEVAGVGFSVHPTTQEPELMLIQAHRGPGEALVSGAVRPDSFVVRKGGGLVEAAGEGALTEPQALAYARLLEQLERHYGRPLDTEWAWADGQFWLLQARPITTLDPGYAQAFYDRSRDWRPNARRPWNLVAASLFAVNLEHTAAVLDLDPLPLLLIGLERKLCQVCLTPADEGRLQARLAQLMEDEPERMAALLRRGLEHAGKVRELYPSLREMLPECSDAVTCGTQIPFQLLKVVQTGELAELAARNRERSTYPWFVETALPPLVRAQVGDYQHPLDIVTVTELLEGPDPAVLRERDERVSRGERYVYQRLDGRETVTFHPDPAFVVARVNGARVPRTEGDAHRLPGAAAYPGLVEGTARVILQPDDAHPEFADGDILVSINANPALLPFLQRCSALVTDEGGPNCHAGILARELKKPCLMGTGDATSRIREGQRIRVDAYEQVVELL